MKTDNVHTKANVAKATPHAGISSISSYWGEGYWGYGYSTNASAYSFPWNRRDIYVDLAFQPGTGVEPIVRRFAAEHRADRILFGSDWPWASPAEHTARIAAWGLPPERLDAILGGNARQLLEL